LFDSLKKAIEINPELKAKAKADREFAKYAADPKFKAIVE